MPINEPEVFLTGLFYEHVSQERFVFKAIKVMKNVMIAHGQVYHALKEIDPKSYIGLVRCTIFDPTEMEYNSLDYIHNPEYVWNGAIISH